ncbi:unnamed protein product [Kuraishia capsulata CBS 1993]|uniref:Enhancer of mRNA-decapping protein 1 n=1 Tax=Kuraishia capsulata CBS 1993 TaxID=1382522 RepID=W6MXY7_9ASCO|nr:uncharacterized protein KUCA_T00005698001 [Kuraishia capsulata CBS 1993]CDK29705.1 unnamed protein product [Kuraishia capsulata CBS 1993]
MMVHESPARQELSEPNTTPAATIKTKNTKKKPSKDSVHIPPAGLLPDGSAPDFGFGAKPKDPVNPKGSDSNRRKDRSTPQKKTKNGAVEKHTGDLKTLLLSKPKESRKKGDKGLPDRTLPDGSVPDFGNGSSNETPKKEKKPKSAKPAAKSSKKAEKPAEHVRTASGEFVYAGASFHESPSAVSLPKPSFLSSRKA